MGLGGLYYRQSLPAGTDRNANKHRSQPGKTPAIPDGTHEAFQQIDSGDVVGMADASSRNLVDELNSKRKLIRRWPICLTVGMLLAIALASSGFPQWATIIGFIFTIAITCYFAYLDVMRKTAVLLYDIDDDFIGVYKMLVSSFEEMMQCENAWHLSASAKILDRKYYAGAGSLVSRHQIRLALKNPPFVKTNIATPCIPVGDQTLFFLPDLVLAFAKNGAGAVSYHKLNISVQGTDFIESGSVPGDADVKGHTWKFVNKSGGPDRRFKDNPQLPIANYEEVSLKSETGLNEIIHLSRRGVALSFRDAINKVGQSNLKISNAHAGD